MGGGEGQEETCRGDWNSHHLDTDEVFMGIGICQNVSNCILLDRQGHYVSYTTMKLFGKQLCCGRISARNTKVSETLHSGS